MRVHRDLLKLTVVVILGLYALPAHAGVDSIATSVLDELKELVTPAITLGFIWLGVLIMTGRASLISFFTFLIGAAILKGGGYF